MDGTCLYEPGAPDLSSDLGNNALSGEDSGFLQELRGT